MILYFIVFNFTSTYSTWVIWLRIDKSCIKRQMQVRDLKIAFLNYALPNDREKPEVPIPLTEGKWSLRDSNVSQGCLNKVTVQHR